MNEEKLIELNDSYSIVNINDTTEKLIKFCKSTRIEESNDILSAFECHFQEIKNGILSVNDFSYEGLFSQINSGILGKITAFFNCVIIYVINISINYPHNLAVEKIKYYLTKNIIITEAVFIGLDFLLLFIIFFFYISSINNYCNQIILLKKIFKIFEIQEQ